MSKDAFKVLGKITPRKDGMARVTGQERYVSDITLPRILHGRIVSSPYAHARVLSVDTRAAEALEAVCLTFTDIPKLRYNERIVTVPWALHKDHTVLADKVRRTGEAVAAVAAETEALAERAVRAVRVEYEPLPVVTDPIEAMQPGAPALHDSVLLGDQELKIERNIACSRDILEGDPARAFAEAEVIVEGTFRTPKIYHAQMETKSVVCRPESDGGITVWPTTQSIHNVRILRGRGFHTSSAGAPQPGDVIDFSGALVKINQDGSVDVVTALMDHGGGTLEALARLVAETLCVPLDKVNISPGDTSITVYDVVTHATRGVYAGGGAVPDLGGGQMSSLCQIVGEVLGVPMERISIYSTDSAVTPLAGTTTATRQLYMSGSAVLQAALAVRQTLLGRAAYHFEAPPEELDMADGQVYVAANPRERLPLADLAAVCAAEGLPLANLALFKAPFKERIDAETGQGDVFPDFTFGAQAVEVAVDTETGEITLLKSVACHDVGRAINPAAVEGQIQGASRQGLGYALLEDFVVRAGRTLTPSLSEYLIPTACDFPETQVIILESGSGVGPFGAKGIGEPALTPAAPAVANAVADALGVRIYDLPITPEKVLRALGGLKDA